MKEEDIMHEVGSYWVGRDRDAYRVFKCGVTHSTSESSYAKTADGLSVAIARCNYLAKREALRTPQSLACRALGRGRRRVPSHPVYAWLESFDPPKTLAWLAAELSVSRPTLQYWIVGERKSRRRILATPIPLAHATLIGLMSEGRVGPNDWPSIV